MIQGNLIPRPLAVLASTVQITFFFGSCTVPKNWLYNLFRVRRQYVWDALVWMKANNEWLCGQVDISTRRMFELPIDDVPREILVVQRTLILLKRIMIQTFNLMKRRTWNLVCC